MLVGHNTLVNLFQRLAETDALASGYIFFGQSQVGKRTFAESLAHYLEKREFDLSPHVLQDALIIEPEGGSIGIETARKIKKYLSELPNVSPRRTVIIDQAETLTLQAENALLKISEEPPTSSLIIFITTNPEALLPTLASRLQKIYFSLISEKDMATFLEKNKFSAGEKKELLRSAGGSAGRLIQLAKGEDPFQGIVKKMVDGSSETRKKIIKEYLETEGSPTNLLDALIFHLFVYPEKYQKMLTRALRVKRELSTLNVNPRLQLESIFT